MLSRSSSSVFIQHSCCLELCQGATVTASDTHAPHLYHQPPPLYQHLFPSCEYVPPHTDLSDLIPPTQDYPTLTAFLHVIPLLGTSCMAGVVLVSNLQSPAVATACLLLGVLPLVTITIHHGRFCGEASAAELPMQMQDVPGSGAALSGSANTALPPNGAD